MDEDVGGVGDSRTRWEKLEENETYKLSFYTKLPETLEADMKRRLKHMMC